MIEPIAVLGTHALARRARATGFGVADVELDRREPSVDGEQRFRRTRGLAEGALLLHDQPHDHRAAQERRQQQGGGMRHAVDGQPGHQQL
jgi:hypothetical protein